MRKLARKVGPCTLAPRVGCSPFESLLRAIAYQQLHKRAAESIIKRVIALFPGRRFPGPPTFWHALARDERGRLFPCQDRGSQGSGCQGARGHAAYDAYDSNTG